VARAIGVCICVVTNSSSPPGWRGRHWNALEYPGRVFATGLTGGLRPINTVYLPTVDSVVENIVSYLQQVLRLVSTYLLYIYIYLYRRLGSPYTRTRGCSLDQN
jgi:hypothetical protein